jgi:hypothetical protein
MLVATWLFATLPDGIVWALCAIAIVALVLLLSRPWKRERKHDLAQH